MTRKRKQTASADRSPIAILRDIQHGTLSPKSLPGDTRRACVEHLIAEGYCAAEVAEILEVSTRTAFRDLSRIRQAHALERNPQVQNELVGQVVLQGRHAIARLRRIGRDRATPAATKVEAELGAWRVTKEQTELLQRLGILPLAAQEIRADLTHRVEEVPTSSQLRQELESLQEIWKEAGAPAALQPALVGVEGLLAKAQASEQVDDLRARLSAGELAEDAEDAEIE